MEIYHDPMVGFNKLIGYADLKFVDVVENAGKI